MYDLERVPTHNSYGLYHDDEFAVLDNHSKCDQEKNSNHLKGFKNTISK